MRYVVTQASCQIRKTAGWACTGKPRTLSPPPRVRDPDVHHGTWVTHVPLCMPGPLTSGFLWSQCRGKRSRRSLRMRNPQFYVCGKTPMVQCDFLNNIRRWSGWFITAAWYSIITMNYWICLGWFVWIYLNCFWSTIAQPLFCLGI